MHELTRHERFALAASGYVIRPAAIPARRAVALGARAQALFDDWKRSGTPSMYHHNSLFRPGLLVDEQLTTLAQLPAVDAIAAELCGADAELTEASLLIDGPDTTPNELHSATNYDDAFPKHFGLTRSGELRIAYTTIFVYLSEVRRGDGGLVLLPGSHHLPPTAFASLHAHTRGDIDASYFGAAEGLREHAPCGFVEVDARPGDLVVMSERIVHGSLSWRPRDRRRVVALLKFVPAGYGKHFRSRFEALRGPLPAAVARRIARPELATCS